MSCPQKYIDKKIKIKTTVKNHEFLSSNSVNDWTFKNYFIWTEDILLRRIKSYCGILPILLTIDWVLA
ncbi:hypothetical protein EDC96DRAFT_526787 [Choanephora cucurbitarum]|nr:hypothetical protein EDC96DRAFT_526787 [Choanephora cucurbitarum]